MHCPPPNCGDPQFLGQGVGLAVGVLTGASVGATIGIVVGAEVGLLIVGDAVGGGHIL